MPQGLQIMDTSSNVIIDTNTPLPRFLGSQAVGGGNQTGSVTNARFADGTPFSFVLGNTDPYTRPDVTFAGTTMSWTVGNPTFTGNILYGVW